MSPSGCRIARCAVGVFGGLVALGSYVMAMVGNTLATILPWLVPECIGLVLVVVGLHAWIDG